MNDISGIMNQICLSKNGPLGFSGGTGCINDQARIIGCNFKPSVFFIIRPKKISLPWKVKDAFVLLYCTFLVNEDNKIFSMGYNVDGQFTKKIIFSRSFGKN